MTLLVNCGDSIEGATLRLMSRAPISTPTPVKDKALGKITYPFRMTQNSEAEIEAALHPKKYRCCESSKLDVGDMVRGARISGLSTRPLPRAELIQGTENHKASQTRCKDFGFAKLEIPLRNVLERQVVKAPTKS